jgi:hypothetical protein
MPTRRLSSDFVKLGRGVMKSLFSFFVLLGVSTMCLAEGEPVTLYMQVIRGTDHDKPPQSDWKPVGPKLSRQLCPKFRWKHYWEVSRQAINVRPGKTVRLRVSPEREVEIELRDSGESEVRLYSAGKLARKSRQPVESHMTIMGGGREDSECWFIVVRRDKPTVD